MIDRDRILQLIKNSVRATAPDATLILYGSYARGDYSEDSDIDLLILINKDKITHADKDKVITYLATAFPNPTNVNKATAKELETALEISSAEAEAVVAYRTKNGDFKTLNDLKKVPEVAAKVDAKKTRVVFK